MTSGKQANVKRLKMSERAEQQLALHFPGYSKEWLWQRKVNDGYTTVPRTLPYVMQAVDEACKGQPPGHTLFCLWARSPDHPLLIIENPATLAAEAGFSGERAVDTWRRRMRHLHELKAIDVKKGASGDFNYVLLMNPNVCMEWMFQSGRVQTDLYGRFLTRVTDIGAFNDLTTIRAAWDAVRAASAGATIPPAMLQPATTGVVAGVAAHPMGSSADLAVVSAVPQLATESVSSRPEAV